MSEQSVANFAIETMETAIPYPSRRSLLTAAAAAGLGGFAFAQSPARAAIVRTDIARLAPYGNSTIAPGIRSRSLSNGNGASAHDM